MKREIVCHGCGASWISDEVDVPACPSCGSDDTEETEYEPDEER